MRIESGTTTEHRVRLGLFLVMLIVFAGYFGYDGMWGYPAKNLDWARQNIPNLPPEQKAYIRTNPRVMVATLVEIEKAVKSPAGITEAKVRELLGEPSAVADHAGSGSVKDHWYVGPAACARVQVADGNVRDLSCLENVNKTESDIKMQKGLGVLLGIIAVGVAIYYIHIMTMKTVLDDAGLAAKRRRVSWDEMTGLDTSDYDRKGWLDVVYRKGGEEGAVRLDSYHIASFDEIVGTICERKDFANPIKPRSTDPADDDDRADA